VITLDIMFTDWRTVVLAGFSHKRHKVPYLNIPPPPTKRSTGVEESTLAIEKEVRETFFSIGREICLSTRTAGS